MIGRLAQAILKPFRDALGLTLYETTAVVAMTAIVAAVALPVAMDRIEQSKGTAAASEALTIVDAMMSFFRDTGRWPGEVEIRRLGSTSCFLQTGVPATDPTLGTLLPPVIELRTDATPRTSRLGSAARTLPQVGNLGIDASQFLGRTCNTLSPAVMLNINEFLVRKPSAIDYPNWAGPYMEPIASDPWDQAYLINVLPLIFATDIPDPGQGRAADTGQTTTVDTVTVSGSAAGVRLADTGRTTRGVSLGFGWIITAGPDRVLQTPLTRPRLDEGSDDLGKNIGARIVKSTGGQSASGLSPTTAR